MNAGMFEMPSGRHATGRVITAVLGRTNADAMYGPFIPGSSFGLATYSNSAPFSQGVRTPIYLATGRGAVRFFHVGLSVFAGLHSFDVVVDGVVISSRGFTTAGAAGSEALIGMQAVNAGSVVSVSLDYINFNQSFGVFFTTTTTIGVGALRWSYLVEAHQ